MRGKGREKKGRGEGRRKGKRKEKGRKEGGGGEGGEEGEEGGEGSWMASTALLARKTSPSGKMKTVSEARWAGEFRDVS